MPLITLPTMDFVNFFIRKSEKYTSNAEPGDSSSTGTGTPSPAPEYPIIHSYKQSTPMPTSIDDTAYQLTVTKSLKLLTNGFKSEFATFAYADPRMAELLMELASEFVDANIPIIEEDTQVEMALMLMETLDLIAR